MSKQLNGFQVLPAALRIPFLFCAVWLVMFSLLRAGLTLWTGTDSVEPRFWPGILGKGLVFDLAALVVLVVPVVLYEALLPNRWRRALWHRTARLLWFGLASALMLLGIAAEVIFWSEFSTRFNFIAVDYLIYTQEVLANIWQSYPVVKMLLLLVMVGAVLAFLLRAKLKRADQQIVSLRDRLRAVLAGIAMPAVALSLLSLDRFDSSGNAYADELAGNGLYSFAAAVRRNELDYDRFYQTIPQDEADGVLAQLGVERGALATASEARSANNQVEDQSDDALPMARRPKNIVLISVESLSASFMGSYGAKESLTPRLDQLAREGLHFLNVYATGTRTVRGLEALSPGTPPVPGQSIVRRPRNEQLQTLGEVIGPQGVKPYFFYGGYGYFDNMNAYFGSNGYTVIDRTDIPTAEIHFENAWGVADEVLFEQAMKTLRVCKCSRTSRSSHIL